MKKISREYKFEDLPPISERELKAVMAIQDKDIDFSEIPERTAEDFSNGGFYYAPSLKTKKIDVHIKLDQDNMDWVQRPAKKGYQTRINKILRWARLNGCPVMQM